MSRLLRVIVVLAIALIFASGATHAGTVDFTHLTLNGVKPGDTADHVKQALGKPSSVKGSKSQFLLYAKDAKKPLTVELGNDGVAFVSNGSALSLDGKKILEVGAPASAIDAALGGTKHEIREKVDSLDYAYYQSGIVLVVVVKGNKIADFVLGKRAY